MTKLLVASIITLAVLSYHIFQKQENGEKLQTSNISVGKYILIDYLKNDLTLYKASNQVAMTLFTGSSSDNDVFTNMFDVKYVPGKTNTVTISWKDSYLQGYTLGLPDILLTTFKEFWTI